jgi:hypothetical protein
MDGPTNKAPTLNEIRAAAAARKTTAMAPVGSPQRAVQEAKVRFSKTLSVDDALAVMNTGGKA